MNIRSEAEVAAATLELIDAVWENSSSPAELSTRVATVLVMAAASYFGRDDSMRSFVEKVCDVAQGSMATSPCKDVHEAFIQRQASKGRH